LRALRPVPRKGSKASSWSWSWSWRSASDGKRPRPPVSLAHLYHDDLGASGVAYLAAGSDIREARVVVRGSAAPSMSSAAGQLGSWLWFAFLGGQRHPVTTQPKAGNTSFGGGAPNDRARAETLTAILQAGLTPDLAVVTTRCIAFVDCSFQMHSAGCTGHSRGHSPGSFPRFSL